MLLGMYFRNLSQILWIYGEIVKFKIIEQNRFEKLPNLNARLGNE
jgi:hypothetical protein